MSVLNWGNSDCSRISMTLLSSASLPCSTSWQTAIAVNSLEPEALPKRVSGRLGFCSALSAQPYAPEAATVVSL
ncbi:hypothetical protein D3C81_1844200 [compost metagenome]